MTTGFLLNRWYMVGWSNEVPADGLLERTVAGKSLVIFRDAECNPRALQNRCPHRFAPLHLGSRLPDGTVRCPYHGLEFDGAGSCTKNPHGDGKIPKSACVPSFTTIEQHGIVWVWLGEQNKADSSLLPDFSMIDEARCFTAKRYLRVKANYVLETDNILDLSHIEFLHPSTLGSSAVSQAKVDIEQAGHTVFSKRFIKGEVLQPFVAATFEVPEGASSDRWLDVRWDPPASMLLTVKVTLSGNAPEAGKSVFIPHIFTPETENTTHYWFGSCMDRGEHPNGAVKVEKHVEGLKIPFTTEDLPMLEAQQKVIGNHDFWGLKPVLLPGDAAAVRARRVLDGLLKAEREAANLPE